jgi:hypothetical protein
MHGRPSRRYRPSRQIPAFIHAALGAGLACGITVASGCGQPCCNVDNQTVPLLAGPGGELMVSVATDAQEGGVGLALLDPGSPVTFWNHLGTPEVTHRDLRLLGPAPPGQGPPLRASFHDVSVVEAPLGSIGAGGTTTAVAAIIGADLLGNFAVEVGFAAREMTFWRRESASDGFLNASGYAVLHLPRRGGGRLEIQTPRDWLGRHPPLDISPSRLLLRACAAPPTFRREDPLPAQCCAADLFRLGVGVNLSLLLSTGVGPVVLGQAAWNRVLQLPEMQSTPPVMEARPLTVAFSATPVPALWASIPRMALVDRQADLVSDPGPCAELGRARRTEQVSLSQSQNPELALCAQPCDREGRAGTLAENSAAYLELEGQIEVAVIDDATPFLQGLRAEVRPQGPEVDGLVGARALGRTHLEIDYFNTDPRAIFSCEPYVLGTSSVPGPIDTPDVTGVGGGGSAGLGCRAVGSCPRLPDNNQTHRCFGLPAHRLPKVCDNASRSCNP